MNFTNIDSAREDIYWEVKAKLRGYVWNQVSAQVWNQVLDQVNWKVNGQINLIKNKIKQDINK